MRCLLILPGGVGGFFLSAWFIMVFWGIVSPHLNIRTIDYPLAMVVTIGLWLAMTPLVITLRKKQRKSW
ncbi:hypothetical protein ACFLTS_00230 [Chloroflexota bacterium]